MEKLSWYALRGKIETFHKILTSGGRAAESRLRTAERLVNLLAIFCLLSWQVFWVTMLHRAAPQLQASVVFTPAELQLLTAYHPIALFDPCVISAVYFRERGESHKYCSLLFSGQRKVAMRAGQIRTKERRD